MPPQTCFLRLYHNSGFFSTKDDKYFEVYRSATSVFAPALAVSHRGRMFWVVPSRSFRVRSREARSSRGRVFGGYTVTQRSYSLPQGAEPPRANVWGCTVTQRSCSLPRGAEPARASVWGYTVSLGWRVDEGVRPYHALSKVSTGIADLPSGDPRRADEERPYLLKPSPWGRDAAVRSTVKTVHRRLF